MKAITTSKRSIKKLNISNSIMAAAEEVFLEKGYRLSSMNSIAKRAKVTKRTLYKHFSSKLALFVHIFDFHLGNQERLLAAGLKRNESPALALKRMYQAFFKFCMRNEKFMRLYWMLDSNEFDGQMPVELMERVGKLTKRMLESQGKLVEQAQAGGSIINAKPMLLVHLFSAINKGIFFHTNKEKRLEIAEISPEELFKVLLMVMDNGVFVKTIKRARK